MKKVRKYLVGLLVIVFALTLSLPMVSLAAEGEPQPVQKGMIYNKPGVVFISSYYTVDLVIQSAADYPELSGATYEVTTGGMGSGFVVNPNGYILTNGHVVKQTEDMLAYNSLAYAAELIVQDIVYVEYQNEFGYPPSQAEIDQMYPLVLQELGGIEAVAELFYQGWRAGEIKMTSTTQDIYVQQGIFVSGEKIAQEQGMKAELKDVDYEGFSDEGEALGKDIALIKVNQTNMPTVLLGDSEDVQIGDSVNVIGYPAVATFESFLDEESQLEPSMTSGIISAEKTMKDGTSVLQTDAAVTHGNSGGPAFIDSGEVIGIASLVAIDPTTGIQKEGFSYLRPINIAKEFLTENGVVNELGETDKHYREGLDDYWNRHYTSAIEEFETTLRLYPGLIDANDYIQKSQEGISKGEEVSETGSLLGWGIGIVLVLGLGFVFLVVIIIIIVVVRKKKKSPPTQTPPPAA